MLDLTTTQNESSDCVCPIDEDGHILCEACFSVGVKTEPVGAVFILENEPPPIEDGSVVIDQDSYFEALGPILVCGFHKDAFVYAGNPEMCFETVYEEKIRTVLSDVLDS